MNIRTRLAVLALAGLTTATAFAGLAVLTTGTPAPAAERTVERIEEDDPRWDCRIHGNGECSRSFSI